MRRLGADAAQVQQQADEQYLGSVQPLLGSQLQEERRCRGGGTRRGGRGDLGRNFGKSPPGRQRRCYHHRGCPPNYEHRKWSLKPDAAV